MRAVLILTTVAAFSGHAFFGCCWHHAHEWRASESPIQSASAGAAVATLCGHGCNCPHAAVPRPEPVQVPGPEPFPCGCDEPDCTFLAAPANSLQIEAPATGPFFQPFEPVLVLQYATQLAQSYEQGHLDGWADRSMRSHLALGVLRI